MNCTQDFGTRTVERSVCEAQGLGLATLYRSCCTNKELVKAEEMRKPSSAASRMALNSMQVR
jgi:hypothetical protein